jgi:hypothetical protein
MERRKDIDERDRKEEKKGNDKETNRGSATNKKMGWEKKRTTEDQS